MSTTPVWKKSEFWITVVTSVSGLLMAFGVISKEQADGISDAVPRMVGGLMSLVSSVRFVIEQNKAKMAVFHAMCALSAPKDGEASALSAPIADQVKDNAVSVGL